MKIFISADIEGSAGITNWDEASRSKPDYAKFAEQMTREVNAACVGASKAGANEIWIKDAHASGRNLDAMELPENIKLIRAWSGHPYSMFQELDDSFDAVLMTGYHSFAGSNGNPLAHTMDDETINFVKINDEWASEFELGLYTASMLNVPVAFVSGDEALCEHVNSFNKNIKTVAVKRGVGNSVISMHPKAAADKIRDTVEEALKGDLSLYKVDLPSKFKVEISYIHHKDAYSSSFYPGVKLISPTNVLFENNDYFEVLRALHFIL